MLVAVGAVVAVVLVATSGDGSGDKKGPSESSETSGGKPTPSLSIPSEIPSELPTEVPSDLPSGLPSDFPSELPSGLPSDLPSGLGDVESLKKAAAALCEKPLERKAQAQPSGTVQGTLVQYPDAAGYKAGIDNVACSLAADGGSGDRNLTEPLS